MRIPIINADSLGILSDVLPHNLPLTAWSSGRNVTFRDGHVEKAAGHKTIFTPEVDPYTLLPLETPQGYFWLYAGEKQAYAWKDEINNLATRASAPYNASENGWTGGVLNGVAVLNNFNDVPQAWVTPGAGNLLSNLPNWNPVWRCRSLRPYKYYLVALGVKEGPNDNPFRVLWSHVADPGTVPGSWDITDATRDAGDKLLAETEGYLVDQLPLKGANIIYKTDSVHVMQHVGGLDIMGFRPLFDTGGLLMPNGVKLFTHRGDHHIVFGPNDIYTHDGAHMNSIMASRMRKWVYNNLDSVNAHKSFIGHNVAGKEIFICFPETGASRPNVALVWDYEQDKTSVRDLPGISCMNTGNVLSVEGGAGTDTWDSDNVSWDADPSPWGSNPYTPITSRLLMASPGSARKVYINGIGTLFEADEFTSYVERVGISILGEDRQGRPIYDSDVTKIVTELWPRIQGDVGTQVDIYVGSQMIESDSVDWQGPLPFIVGQNEKVDPYVVGKILSVRFVVKSTTHWKLSGYDLEVVGGGQY